MSFHLPKPLFSFLAKTTGKKALIWFIVTNAVYACMLLYTIPYTVNLAGGMALPDMMPLGYDHAYVIRLLHSLGQEGRHAYLYTQIPLDMVYPGLFALAYAQVMAFFLLRLGRYHSALYILCLLPVLAGTADYLENFGIISLIHHFPSVSASTVGITGAFSIIKSLSTTVYFFALIGIVIWFVAARPWANGKSA
ncbi:MAG: hypothetical protein HYZ16_09965 [Bacteroidetes bacterium]|jgi:hypothetical protein|nr:hypothetical protein [Bacteroidota bacterium]